jgi:hypothetical protein
MLGNAFQCQAKSPHNEVWQIHRAFEAKSGPTNARTAAEVF